MYEKRRNIISAFMVLCSIVNLQLLWVKLEMHFRAGVQHVLPETFKGTFSRGRRGYLISVEYFLYQLITYSIFPPKKWIFENLCEY